MKKLFLLLLLTSKLFTQENAEFYDSTELKRGMKGYALTVFQGIEPEKMELEIISYIPNYLPQAGLILVKLTSENAERSRVAAGMSGSPVYIDDKLVGALAYTWANARELTAGVVPIQDMVSDKARNGNISFNPPSDIVPIQTAWTLDGMIGDTELLQQIQNISSESMYPRGIEEFKTVPSSRSNGVAPLKGGDAVAIKLVEGDINIASIGTVTYVDGEDIYIYGHPMDGEGPINLPMSRAEIFDIMPSTSLSFKIGRALPETIGATMFDGLSTVYGRFDKQATMIPMKFSVLGKNISNTYNMNVARSQKYLPTMLGEVAGRILERELGKNVEKQILLSWNIELTNGTTISNSVTWVKNTIYNPQSIAEYWKNYISLLWGNSFEHFVPTSVNFNVDILDKPYNYFNVSEAKISHQTFLSGKSVDVSMVLDRYLGDKIYTNVTLELPENLESGTYSLLVGSELFIEQQLLNVFPEFYAIRTPNKIIEELGKPINTHNLQIALIDTRTGSIIANKFFEPMPKSKSILFKSQRLDKTFLYSPYLIQKTVKLEDPVLGGDQVYIDVYSPASSNSTTSNENPSKQTEEL